MLTFPDSQGTYTLYTDAFNKQMGCVHLQKYPNGTDGPVGLGSCFLETLSVHMIPHKENASHWCGQHFSPVLLEKDFDLPSGLTMKCVNGLQI